MANSKLCVAIRFILTCTILLLSVEAMRKFSTVEAKTCMEGLTTVDVTCRRSEADQLCWIACQQKHGASAQAWCRYVIPGLPAQVCMCTYPC